MPVIWVMLQLSSFQHLRKVGGSWEEEPHSTCVLADAMGGPPGGLGCSRSPGRTTGRWPLEEGELPDAPLGRTSTHGGQEQPGSCLFLLGHSPPAAAVSAAFTVPESEVLFATHIFGIKYSFLTSPSKVTGKLTNSQLEGWRSVKKKFLGFEIKMCGCAYEILTVKTTYHPLQSFSQRQMKPAHEIVLGNMTSGSGGAGAVTCP